MKQRPCRLWILIFALLIASTRGVLGQAIAQEIPAAAKQAFDAGTVKLRQGASAEGIALMKQALKIHPDYFDALFALATELGKRDASASEALETVERARRINDRDPRVYFLFGILMARQQKYAVAELAFREAIERDRMNAQSYFSHALALIELAIREREPARRNADLGEAERDLHRALILSGRKMHTAYLQLARVQEQRGDRKAAADMLATYLKHQPEDKNAPAIRAAITKLRR